MLDCCPDYSVGIWSTKMNVTNALAIGDSMIIERTPGASKESVGLFPGYDFRKIKLKRIAAPQKSK
jgi:hypothetical protein